MVGWIVHEPFLSSKTMFNFNKTTMKLKVIKYLFALTAIVLGFTSCVDYSNATGVVTAKIQLQLPAELDGQTSLEGHTVTLQLNGKTYTERTDAQGVATFPGLTPDVYNVSVTWDLSSADYQRITGSTEAVAGIVSGSLNAQLISDSNPLILTPTLSPKRNIVISKIYTAGAKDIHNKRYVAGQYIELYNQSSDSVDIAGLYIGLLETDNPQAYTLENLHTQYADSVVLVKQLFQIPADKAHKIAPGAAVVITNSAIDHRVNSTMEHNLLDADYEAKDVKAKLINNPQTPALESIFNSLPGLSYMNMLTTGQGVIIFRTDKDMRNLPLTYKFGKTSGTRYGLVPKRYIIDGVDFIKRKATGGADVREKRLYNDIDAGYININTTTGLSGEVVYRKVASTGANGHKILMDTNNSSNDFAVSTTIAPREF